jgi:hypothetical protein
LLLWRRLVAPNLAALVAASAATLAVELGTWWGLDALGAPADKAVLASLLAACVWTALASPFLAASGADWLAGLLRGGIVADASAVFLAVLWLGTPYVSLAAACELYCVLAAMALVGVAAGRLGGGPGGRWWPAAAAAVLMLAATFTPLWSGGLIMRYAGPQRQAVVGWLVDVSPFYSCTAAVLDSTGFIWHSTSMLYRVSLFFDFSSPPPARWWMAPATFTAAAALLAAGGVARRRFSSS